MQHLTLDISAARDKIKEKKNEIERGKCKGDRTVVYKVAIAPSPDEWHVSVSFCRKNENKNHVLYFWLGACEYEPVQSALTRTAAPGT